MMPTVIMNTSTFQQQYTQPASITTCNNNRAFNEFLYEFLLIILIQENSLKFANFFCWSNDLSIYERDRKQGHVIYLFKYWKTSKTVSQTIKKQ